TTTDNITVNYIAVEDESNVTLETIHQDLGFICTFLVIAAVLIFMRIIYKLFNMFF
ncbi:MAG: hypothetical protein HFJ17_02245, partial [Clostridia bacterium]|nr:hypothetical protein [Clostridia bacterium]